MIASEEETHRGANRTRTASPLIPTGHAHAAAVPGSWMMCAVCIMPVSDTKDGIGRRRGYEDVENGK
jgi:hypothetical protein